VCGATVSSNDDDGLSRRHSRTAGFFFDVLEKRVAWRQLFSRSNLVGLAMVYCSFRIARDDKRHHRNLRFRPNKHRLRGSEQWHFDSVYQHKGLPSTQGDCVEIFA
jgi:hypothetical protein